jgi:hypothetical protein
MTLSRFLRAYLYIPLGGNQRGRFRTYANLAITMVLGGLWHGAAWTFVVWGAFHGTCLIVNRLWDELRSQRSRAPAPSRARTLAAWALTFLCVVIGWVVFRAKTLAGASAVLAGMVGANGMPLPSTYLPHLNRLFSLGDRMAASGVRFVKLPHFGGADQMLLLIVVLLAALLLPNVRQIVGGGTSAETAAARPAWWRWRPSPAWGFATAAILIASICGLSENSAFLYFQF